MSKRNARGGGRSRAREALVASVRSSDSACYGRTMERACFETMSDDRVVERVQVLVARSNQLTAELLAYLAEVDRRGLYLREATGSLFAFCVERLHMSEGAAGKRITAARTARRFPRAVSYTHLRAHETPEHLVCR